MPRCDEEQRGGAEARDALDVGVPHDAPAPACVLMPNTIRCAASPARVRRDGRHGEHRAHAVHPSGRHRVGHRAVDGPRAVVGPEHVRAGIAPTASSASATGTATMKMTAAAPLSSAPNSQRGTSMKLAPRNAAAAAGRGRDRVHRRPPGRAARRAGSAADRPDETNRVKPLTISAPNRIARSLAPTASSAATAEHQHQPRRGSRR